MSCSGVRVTFPSDHPLGDCHGVVFASEADPSHKCGGLILLHAWWGLNEEILTHADQVRRESGLTVLVPDLYRGKVTKDRETAGHYMADLDWQGAVSDVQGCARFLLKYGCPKVGVSGFCMGGALSLLSAAKVPELSASAPFYGIPKPHLADLTTIRIPVQGHFGDQDNVTGLSSPDDFYPLEAKLKGAGVNFDLRVYKGAGHGFAHPSYPTYHAEAAGQAFSAMFAFMQRHLTA